MSDHLCLPPLHPSRRTAERARERDQRRSPAGTRPVRLAAARPLAFSSQRVPQAPAQALCASRLQLPPRRRQPPLSRAAAVPLRGMRATLCGAVCCRGALPMQRRV